MMDRTVLYDVADAHVYGVTDPGDHETSPTYADGVDVPGIRNVALTPSYQSNSLKGDGRTIDKRTKLDAVSLAFEYAKLDPAVLAVVDGGNAVTVGDVTEYRRKADDLVPYFGFAGLVTEVDNPGGSALLVVAYVKIEDGTLFGAQTDTYGLPSFTAEGVYTPSGFLWKARLDADGEELPETGADFALLLDDLVVPAP
jgi:hypothetical protein